MFAFSIIVLLPFPSKIVVLSSSLLINPVNDLPSLVVIVLYLISFLVAFLDANNSSNTVGRMPISLSGNCANRQIFLPQIILSTFALVALRIYL